MGFEGDCLNRNRTVCLVQCVKSSSYYTWKFPTVVGCASEFIKSHGYAAHVCRRESIASTPGVSLGAIQSHLLVNVPGLKEHGVSSLW